MSLPLKEPYTRHRTHSLIPQSGLDSIIPRHSSSVNSSGLLRRDPRFVNSDHPVSVSFLVVDDTFVV